MKNINHIKTVFFKSFFLLLIIYFYLISDSLSQNCTTPVSIDPPGPITMCNGQSITLNAGNGYSSYSWLTAGTMPVINFTIINYPADIKSNLIITDGYLPLMSDYAGIIYTTDGTFTVDSTGKLIHNATGYPLGFSQIVIPGNAQSIIIDENGLVTAKTLVQGDTNSTQLGQIYMASFANPSGLELIGEKLYKASVNSGAPMYKVPQPRNYNVRGWTTERNTQIINFSGSYLLLDQLNLSVGGNGYFKLQSTNDGIVYTRDGAFTMDANRMIIHKSSGYPLIPMVFIPILIILIGGMEMLLTYLLFATHILHRVNIP